MQFYMQQAAIKNSFYLLDKKINVMTENSLGRSRGMERESFRSNNRD